MPARPGSNGRGTGINIWVYPAGSIALIVTPPLVAGDVTVVVVGLEVPFECFGLIGQAVPNYETVIDARISKEDHLIRIVDGSLKLCVRTPPGAEINFPQVLEPQTILPITLSGTGHHSLV